MISTVVYEESRAESNKCIRYELLSILTLSANMAF